MVLAHNLMWFAVFALALTGGRAEDLVVETGSCAAGDHHCLAGNDEGLELRQLRGQMMLEVNDEHQKRMDEINKQKEQLRKVIQEGGMDRKDKALDTLVKTITDQIKEKVLPGIVKGHEVSVQSLTAAIKEITSCESHLDNGYKEAAVKTTSEGTEHDGCRTAQGPLNTTCQAKKADVDAEIALMKSTPSTEAIIRAKSDLMSHYDEISKEVTALEAWGNEKVKVYLPKLKEYKEAKTALETKQTQCNKEQRDFETAWCGWRSDLVTACSSYSTCRKAKVSVFDTTKATVETAVKSSKAEFRGANQILCYVKLLNANDAHKHISKCDTETYDTSHLDIVPPTVPEEKKCDTSPVTTFPCQAPWVKTELTSKAWHTLAPAAVCHAPCPEIGTEAKAPAEPAFGGDEPAFGGKGGDEPSFK